jgi:hypothetical protein
VYFSNGKPFVILSYSYTLDYSIRDSSPLSYHLGFIVGLAEGVPSSMVPEPRSWVQIPPVTQFSVALILPSLASVGPVGMVAPEWEQAAPTVAARTQEGECWTRA